MSLFERREKEPGNDLISALLAVRDEKDGRLSHDELTSNINLLFVAGHETTANLIGNGLLALHRQPDQWQKLTLIPRSRQMRSRNYCATIPPRS